MLVLATAAGAAVGLMSHISTSSQGSAYVSLAAKWLYAMLPQPTRAKRILRSEIELM